MSEFKAKTTNTLFKMNLILFKNHNGSFMYAYVHKRVQMPLGIDK